MNKYENSKIYRIRCLNTGNIYIGSTTQRWLCQRLAVHKKKYDYFLSGNNHFVSVFDIFQNENYVMELIENYPCNSKKELFERERFFIENEPKCVNLCNPIRTRIDNNESAKKYRQKFPEKIKQWNNYYKTLKKVCNICNKSISYTHYARHKRIHE